MTPDLQRVNLPGYSIPGHPDLPNALKIDNGAVRMVRAMQRLGMEIDVPYLHDLSSRIDRRSVELGAEILDSHVPQDFLDGFVSESFNLDSPEQVGELLFGRLEVGRGKELKLTDSGNRHSTDKKQLEMLRGDHPIVPMILEYRELAKLKSTYVDALPRLAVVHPKGTGCPVCGVRHWKPSPRVHTRIVGTRTGTGRYSSRSPNLQNIPIRTDLGQEVRKAFMASEGKKLVMNDYSQIELRLLAHCAREDNMIVVFWEGGDIHTATACDVFEKPADQIDPIKERMPCKNVNFAVAYGESAMGLQQQMYLSKIFWTLEECQAFIDLWFEKRPGVKKYIEEQHYRAFRYGFVWDLFGGIRLVPDVRSSLDRNVARGLRMASNQPIQSTAAGLMKLAMISLSDGMEDRLDWARPLMTIHDELIHEVDEDRAEVFGEFAAGSMESAVDLRVPVKCGTVVDERWVKE